MAESAVSGLKVSSAHSVWSRLNRSPVEGLRFLLQSWCEKKTHAASLPIPGDSDMHGPIWVMLGGPPLANVGRDYPMVSTAAQPVESEKRVQSTADDEPYV